MSEDCDLANGCINFCDSDVFLLSSIRYEKDELDNYGVVIDEDFDRARSIVLIVDFMRRLASLDAVERYSLKIHRNGFPEGISGGAFRRVLGSVDLNLKDIYSHHVFHPLVEMFYDTIGKYPSHGWYPFEYSSAGLCEYVERLNSANEELWKSVRASEWKMKEKNFRRSANKNLKGLKGYFKSLQSAYSRILVMRIDLGYVEGHAIQSAQGGVTLNGTITHRVMLLKLLRRRFGRAFLGYAIKLEYGRKKGYHHHAFFFLDGSKHQADVMIGKEIGEIWKSEVTDGNGVYFNCNAKKDMYRNVGVGMAKWGDSMFLKGFNIAAEYLAKPDFYMQVEREGSRRVFCRSVAKENRVVKRGRPRMIG